MTDPLSLDSASARFGLPLLFAGQAQKEVFVNAAFSTIDGLLHLAIEGERSAPPASPGDGEAWLVAVNPTGEWVGLGGQIALRQAGQWFYVAPSDGMQMLDRSRSQIVRRIAGAWCAPSLPQAPVGGSTVDTEARQAISAIVASLQQWGAFPT